MADSSGGGQSRRSAGSFLSVRGKASLPGEAFGVVADQLSSGPAGRGPTGPSGPLSQCVSLSGIPRSVGADLLFDLRSKGAGAGLSSLWRRGLESGPTGSVHRLVGAPTPTRFGPGGQQQPLFIAACRAGRTPHFASHNLALAVGQLRQDWPLHHGVALWLVETFVEQERFSGTCYRAATWIKVGQTQGRTRNDRSNKIQVPRKDVYLLPLAADFRHRLGVEP